MLLFALALVLPSLSGWPSLHQPHLWHSSAAWRLTVAQNRFDGSISCSIARRGASYVPGAVVLQLDPTTDTSQAEYRVDDGAPRVAVHLLEALGVPKKGGLNIAVFNPSRGQIMVPEGEVLNAREVEVQTNPRYPIIYFRVDGLSKALSQAASAGCGTFSG